MYSSSGSKGCAFTGKEREIMWIVVSFFMITMMARRSNDITLGWYDRLLEMVQFLIALVL